MAMLAKLRAKLHGGCSRVQRRQGSRLAHFRPRVEQLEERALLSTLTVTKFTDSGPGSLRATIAAANDGDTIKFSSGLKGRTILLTSGEILVNTSLDIHGLGAGRLAVSGNNTSRIFDIGPDAMAVTITGLTFKNGRANQGAAILDDGSSLTLTSCILTNNQAMGAAGAASGNGAYAAGGALAVLGESTVDMTVTVTGCRFLSNKASGGNGGPTDGVSAGGSGGDAQGGAIFIDAGVSASLSFTASGTGFNHNSAGGGTGGTGTGDGGLARGGAIFFEASSSSDAAFYLSKDTFTNLNSASGGIGGAGAAGLGAVHTAGGGGGAAQGGAVWIDAGLASQPYFAFSSDTFSKCMAVGNGGGNATTGEFGGRGGDAHGGALFYIAGTAAGPALAINASSFSMNTSQGGGGGLGGNATFAGTGGWGGNVTGGAVDANFQDSAAGSDNFTGDTFSRNQALGGSGGTGGTGGVSGPFGSGGDGGMGGVSFGGGINIDTGAFASGTQVNFARCAITNNLGQSGNGGDGGTGDGGGNGGDNFSCWGGGLRFHSEIPGGATWTVDSCTIANNQAISGVGGDGGTGAYGGNGGGAFFAAGGGVFDDFDGALHFLRCVIIRNKAVTGAGGLGGLGTLSSGSNGGTDYSYGGGLYITDGGGTACKTNDTQIRDNNADVSFDVLGTIGTC
jgi:hypothetical protein